MAAEKANTLVIGIIRSSHGVAGKFKVESTSGEAEHFFKLKEVTLGKKNENGTIFEKDFKVEAVEGNVHSLIMKLKGIETPEDAKKVQGAEILVSRDNACPLKKDEYYVEDLKQCRLVYKTKTNEGLQKEFDIDSDGNIVVGIITDVLEGGSGNLLEVELTSSKSDEGAESLDAMSDGTDKNDAKNAHEARRVLVPYNKEFIGTVDIKDKVIQLMHLWILE